MAGAFRNKFISLGMSCKNWREGIMLFSETHSTGERAVGIAVNAALGTGAIDNDINTFSTAAGRALDRIFFQGKRRRDQFFNQITVNTSSRTDSISGEIH